MRILLLGATGFVGRNVAEVFADAGVPLVARSRRDGWDLMDPARTERELRDLKPQMIINCAASVGSLNYVTEQAADIVDQNMQMLLNLYRACAAVAPQATIINPVANCAFPGELSLFREDSVWDGELHSSVVAYGSTRRMLLVLSDCYRMQRGLRSVNFFVPNMYGPYDSTDPNKAHALNALVSRAVRARASGETSLTLWGSGIAIREWLYAGDFARLLLEAIGRLDEPHFNQPLNFAQNRGWSIRQIIELVLAEYDFDCRIEWETSKPDGAPCKIMDDARFRAVFPEFRFTDLRRGIRATIDYYESLQPRPEAGAQSSHVKP
ncbi:MAG TPA: NAD-dependent epimerase/dehydratase family protein [Pirellulales bacterium]